MVQLEDPLTELEPAEQFWQIEFWVPTENVPRGHNVHDVLPDNEKRPLKQIEHVDELFELEYVPTGHCVQDDCPEFENRPAAQSTHRSCVGGCIFPPGHVVHVAWPEVDTSPVLHIVQVADAAEE
jgi:hypothetical protein